MRKRWIDNKTVIITGASSGIGKALAEVLIKKHNCQVLGIGRNKDRLENFKNSLKEKSELFNYFTFDVSVYENWVNFATELNSKAIKPNILINNAGVLPNFAVFEKYSIDETKKILDVNFYSSVYSIKTFLPILLESSDNAIVNVSSSSALSPVVGTTLYTASKTALKGFTEVLAQDYKKRLYVCLVCPGFTKTDIFSNQKVKAENTLIDKVCSPLDKAVKKIYKGILKRKKRIITGLDAKAMNFFYKIMPIKTANITTAVLKKSKLPLFNEVFFDNTLDNDE